MGQAAAPAEVPGKATMQAACHLPKTISWPSPVLVFSQGTRLAKKLMGSVSSVPQTQWEANNPLDNPWATTPKLVPSASSQTYKNPRYSVFHDANQLGQEPPLQSQES